RHRGPRIEPTRCSRIENCKLHILGKPRRNRTIARRSNARCLLRDHCLHCLPCNGPDLSEQTWRNALLVAFDRKRPPPSQGEERREMTSVNISRPTLKSVRRRSQRLQVFQLPNGGWQSVSL